MTKNSTTLYILLLVSLMACLSGCKSDSSGEQSTQSEGKKDTYVRGELPVQHGMELFNQHCANCHNFTENGIGPNLSGVTSQVDKAWLISFINNPPAVIESGDERAVQMFEKFKLYMPPFQMLEGEEVEDILGFIHKFSEGEKRNRNNRPGGILNPVVDKITQSDLTLVLEEYLVVPPSASISPFTRINKMTTIGKKRLFIHDLRGKLYEIKADKKMQVYLDLATTLPAFIDNPGHAAGFGSLAFHPDFNKNGLFYTTHTEPHHSALADYAIDDSIRITVQGVLSEWKTMDPAAAQFSGTHRELLRVDMVSGAHGFQEITFNPLAKPGTADYGKLYLGIGDGGAALAGYPFLCDNTTHIWGSVIRIDPLGQNSTNGKYGIPSDNPFVKEPNALGEIWARGFRNPHRISWDETGSGKMLITNIGQHSLEEINLGKAGADYGWPNREGTFLFDVDANPELVYPLPSDDARYSYPVAQYDHDEGNAISGGFVYAGSAIPLLKGKYIFGDIPRGTLFYAEINEMIEGQQAPVYRLQLAINDQLSDLETITENKRVDLRIGMDGTGELYLLTKSNGHVYKVVDAKLSTNL